MLFCEECGAPLAADARFCEQCGTPVPVLPAPLHWEKATGHVSKSGFLYGERCRKLFWNHYNQRSEFPPVDAGTQFRFDQGHAVGALAHTLFPGGVLVPHDPRNLAGSVESTRRELARRVPLFEASFAHGPAYARVDVLNPVGADEWDLIEVKSSTRVKEEHWLDVAFQRHVVTQSGLKVRDCHVVHLNRWYQLQEPLRPKQLLSQVWVSDAVAAVAQDFDRKVQGLVRLSRENLEPEVPIGSYCDKPYPCALKARCWAFLPPDNVFTLCRAGDKAHELFVAGVVSLLDVEREQLTPRQRIQQAAVRTGEAQIRPEKIQAWLEKLEYPLHLLDFETLGFAIPQHRLARPYQQVPFQFALGVVKAPGAAMERMDFLAEDTGDHRPELLRQLRRGIGPRGSVVAYNAPFERRCLREAAEAYPEFEPWVSQIAERTLDLLEPFRRFHYYHPSQQGSASLKAIMPLLAGRGYEALAIRSGMAAVAAFMQSCAAETSEADRARLRRELLEYCGTDTEGMLGVCESLARMA